MKKIFTLVFAVALLLGCTSKKEETVDEKTGINLIEVSQLAEDMKKDNTVVVDARSYDEYNGWDIDGSGVEGHIPGALSVPRSAVNEKNLDAILKRKEVSSEDSIVLYGGEASELAQLMEEKGYSVSLLDGGAKAWAEAGNTLDFLQNKSMIVPVSWVKDLMEGKEVSDYDGRPVKIINAGWDETGEAHKKGHIPGSYWAHLGWVEEGPLWNRVSDEKIKAEMERMGITKDTLLLLYGKDQTPAARFGIIARYMGVEDVRLINGGLKAWEAAGYPMETEYVEPEAVEYFGADKPMNPNLIIDLPEAVEYLKDGESDLVSIRSWKEYKGETSGYDYIKARGRIKGSKWGMGGSDPWHLEDYRAMDEAHMRPYTELAQMWQGLKIDTKHNLAFYCGTGWRASEVWFYAQAMGVDTTSIYDGGWKEWSTTEETKDAYLRGEPEKLNEESFLD
ncbi:thiosulfate sulfurtransferase [Propionigenium maris DSM 9537]|uniref:Thiosulfate sulfurtransferase n=1 Tax=Propionigenium maris DSM 9537 TaxID=1123000 RepID=A0A9W6GKK9_9FUSO|nr:rhodanese-like domain-containing protein [Propionigenium maris]GLI56843.1 thiosulfate sulfurtransferase [Propionigenium maris DSM 9537]